MSDASWSNSPVRDSKKLPPGPWISVALLWLCFGLPVSALAFIGVPALLALFGAGLLDAAKVPLEHWSAAEPWVLVALTAIAIHRRASFFHRREEVGPSSMRLWIGVGALVSVAWLGLLGLEHVPRTELNPKLHYWALSIVVGWSSLTIAWITGRGVSRILLPLELAVLRSATTRGAVTAAGPMSAVGMLAVGGVVLGYDLAEEQIEDAQAVVSSSLPESSSRPTDPRTWTFEECIEAIYEGGHNSPFKQAVRKVSSLVGADAEDIAAETSITVCEKQPSVRELRSYYLKSVVNRARTSHTRRNRLDECIFAGEEAYRIPTGETLGDCAFAQLCKLKLEQQQVLRLYLQNFTGEEIATQLGITTAAATKRRQRALGELGKLVARECAH
jgi:DNA-directed RNA polymerase specialized sigma24 family protein